MHLCRSQCLSHKSTRLCVLYMQDAHIPGLVYGVVRRESSFRARWDEGQTGVGGAATGDGEHVVSGGVDVQGVHRARHAQAARRWQVSLDALGRNLCAGDARVDDIRPPTRRASGCRDLLSHVGGFVTDNPWGDRQQVLPEAEFTRHAARKVSDSRGRPDIGVRILELRVTRSSGRIIANVSGQPDVKDYIEQKIMRPLGMTAHRIRYHASPPDRAARDRLSLGERGVRRASPTWCTARSVRWAACRPAPTTTRSWVAFLLSAWPPRDDARERSGASEPPCARWRRDSTSRSGCGGPAAMPPHACRRLTYGMGLRVRTIAMSG